ncbi:MAG TPA: DMT family transporter [Acidiferrobacterales bacterium]|nr:DMT family transporter [Acidiferrobacterales bacterium]
MSAHKSASHPAPAWIAIMPAIFVVLWSTGFVGAKYGLPYAEPFTFLLWRFMIVALLLLLAAFALRAPWPATRAEFGHIAVAGVLVHASYLGGVFSAIHHGVSAGEVALIAGLQPVLTAAVAGPVLGERVSARQWAGFVLGFVGVVLVVSNRLDPGGAGMVGYLAAFLALAGITAGTLYQKRFCSHMDLRSGAVIQFSASAALMAVLALLTESMVVNWSGEFIFSLAWLVLVLSLGAISLLYLLIRHGEAARVTSMFYLVPPVTALMAYALFGERLGVVALVGMGLVVIGVALVVVRPRSA